MAPSSAGAAVDWLVVSGVGTEGDAEVLRAPGVPTTGAQLGGAHTHADPTPRARGHPSPTLGVVWGQCPSAPGVRRGHSRQVQGEAIRAGEPAWRHLLGPSLATPLAFAGRDMISVLGPGGLRPGPCGQEGAQQTAGWMGRQTWRCTVRADAPSPKFQPGWDQLPEDRHKGPAQGGPQGSHAAGMGCKAVRP